MKILLLVHQDLIPPVSYSTSRERAHSPCKTEFDVWRALLDLGHDVEVLGVSNSIEDITASIKKFEPKVVFNLLEEFANEAIFDHNIVSLLQMLNIPYTGCSPRGLMVARDKALAKKVMNYHGIPTPDFQVFRFGRNIENQISNEAYPLFVKTLNEEASLGITQSSIVKNKEQLLKRVEFLFSNFKTDVIAESYIEGRELYVGVMGGKRPQLMPIWEMDFGSLPNSVPKIATRNIKWNPDYRMKYSIDTKPAKFFDHKQEASIINNCREIYQVLELDGYARLDLRLASCGTLYFIEANPNPDISMDEDFAVSAKHMGLGYSALLQKIISQSLAR